MSTYANQDELVHESAYMLDDDIKRGIWNISMYPVWFAKNRLNGQEVMEYISVLLQRIDISVLLQRSTEISILPTLNKNIYLHSSKSLSDRLRMVMRSKETTGKMRRESMEEILSYRVALK